jgi:hypothetical protein
VRVTTTDDGRLVLERIELPDEGFETSDAALF